MSVEVALIIAGGILLVTLISLLAFVSVRRRAAQEEEMKRAAAARGWQFEVKRERGYRVHRWSGSTDAVAWTAESLRQVSGGNKNQKRRDIARWHGTWHPGINGAIVCMGVPKGKEATGQGIAQGAGWVARLARKAAGFAFDTSLDVYFGDTLGKEVDAGTMHRLDSARTPGFIVMAADQDEGARVLSQGLQRTLADGVNDQGSVLSETRRPWILLRPTGISLARMERFRDVNEIDRFTRAGLALMRAFTFGRRSPS
jgi:hypothetical protein